MKILVELTSWFLTKVFFSSSCIIHHIKFILFKTLVILFSNLCLINPIRTNYVEWATPNYRKPTSPHLISSSTYNHMLNFRNKDNENSTIFTLLSLTLWFTSKQVCMIQPFANDITSFSRAHNTRAISYQAALPLLSKTVALAIFMTSFDTESLCVLSTSISFPWWLLQDTKTQIQSLAADPYFLMNNTCDFSQRILTNVQLPLFQYFAQGL